VVGHHDPRGNLEAPPADRYARNLPFPTDPLSLGAFKEWQWDHDWGDRAGKESAAEHSGTRLCRLLARYAAAYLFGHAHRDEQRHYQAGDEIIPGVRAEHAIDFVRVTAAAGAPVGPASYWGYRLFRATADGRVDTTPFDGARAMLSVPAGTVWA